jgi:hypothetical protein
MLEVNMKADAEDLWTVAVNLAAAGLGVLATLLWLIEVQAAKGKSDTTAGAPLATGAAMWRTLPFHRNRNRVPRNIVPRFCAREFYDS